MKRSCFSFLVLVCTWLTGTAALSGNDTLRTMRYVSGTPAEAFSWQQNLRTKFVKILNINDLINSKNSNPLQVRELSTVDKGTYLLREISLQSTPGRRITVLVTIPKTSPGPWPAVVCIHGHGGQIRSVYDQSSIYKGFADALASGNYVTIAPVVSQHVVAEKDRLLMGERLWDLIRCVDYLEGLPGVDRERIGCAGLSLGGEMSMWLGAMDTRIRATVSCGFLTRMDQLEKNHCLCWKFDGLRQLADFADIYSLIAPRALQCQNGLKEPRDQFYVPLAQEALKEIEPIYKDLNHPERLELDVHAGGHEVDLPALLSFLKKHLASE